MFFSFSFLTLKVAHIFRVPMVFSLCLSFLSVFKHEFSYFYICSNYWTGRVRSLTLLNRHGLLFFHILLIFQKLPLPFLLFLFLTHILILSLYFTYTLFSFYFLLSLLYLINLILSTALPCIQHFSLRLYISIFLSIYFSRALFAHTPFIRFILSHKFIKSPLTLMSPSPSTFPSLLLLLFHCFSFVVFVRATITAGSSIYLTSSC